MAGPKHFPAENAHEGYAQSGYAQNGHARSPLPHSAHPQNGHGTYPEHPPEDTALPGQGAARSSVGGLVNLAGAVTSLALVIGVGVWGYQMMMRDVSGVPVVRAAEGPMRVQPENPGGRQASHQGLAVNDVVAEGEAAGPRESFILAPEPLDLSLDDAQPMQQDASLAPGAERGEADRSDLSATQLAALDALASELAEGVTPLEDLPNTPDVTTEEALSTQDVTVEAEVEEPREPIIGGLSRSLRPQLRPGDLAVTVATGAIEARTAALGPADVDPETIPVGTRLAQLGAYASREIAEAEWTKLTENFSDYLDGKQRVIQRASRGGRTFYRLRAMGFDDLSEARRFCSALVSEKAECIPVLIR